MTSPRFLGAGLLLAALAAACGNTVVTTGGTGAGTSTGTDTGATTTNPATTAASSSSSGAGGEGGGTTSPAGCPSSAVTAGAPCTADSAVCGYGDSVLAECRQVFTCTSGVWTPQPLSCPTPSPACPATQPAEQASCDVDAGATDCTYADGAVCSCGVCPSFGGVCMPGPPAWFCAAPAGNSGGCPAVIPNEGTSCGDMVATCHYPSANCGWSASCMFGSWQWEPQPCPP